MHDQIWHMAQVQGEHMFLMHCWHYGPWWQCSWFILLWWWVMHLIRLVVDSLIVFAWSLYCSWHIYGWGLLVEYMDDYSSCIDGDMMMMRSYLYDDRLFRTYVDWWRCFHLMALGSWRSGWLWMSWCRSTLMLTDTIIQCCCWSLSWAYLDVWSLSWLSFDVKVIARLML